jgi:transcriptional regulator with XRE-family HTH domain
MSERTETKQVGDPEVLKALSLVSQRQLARQIGVTPPYLSMVFAGRRVPRMPVLQKLARALGVSIEQFYRHIQIVAKARSQVA